MNQFLRVFILLGVLGVSKAHHFIRLIVLAGLGLAGLWMVHTLAQDYNNIASASSGSGGGAGGGKFFEKRSIDNHNFRGINWEFVLSRDPASCARSFICQLAAQEEHSLDQVERNILKLTRDSSEQDSWASKLLQEALKHGEHVENPVNCMKIYKLCPYTSRTMARLLRLFSVS